MLPLVVPVVSIILIWQILFDWNGSLNAWLQSDILYEEDSIILESSEPLEDGNRVRLQ